MTVSFGRNRTIAVSAKRRRRGRLYVHEQERDRRVVSYEFGERLLGLRGGDVEAIADRLSHGFFDGDLVAIRDRGREALAYDETSNNHHLVPADSAGDPLTCRHLLIGVREGMDGRARRPLVRRESSIGFGGARRHHEFGRAERDGTCGRQELSAEHAIYTDSHL